MLPLPTGATVATATSAVPAATGASVVVLIVDVGAGVVPATAGAVVVPDTGALVGLPSLETGVSVEVVTGALVSEFAGDTVGTSGSAGKGASAIFPTPNVVDGARVSVEGATLYVGTEVLLGARDLPGSCVCASLLSDLLVELICFFFSLLLGLLFLLFNEFFSAFRLFDLVPAFFSVLADSIFFGEERFLVAVGASKLMPLALFGSLVVVLNTLELLFDDFFLFFVDCLDLECFEATSAL